MTPSTVSAPHNIPLGVALIVATAFLISVQDVVFKVFSSDVTLWQIFALRGMIAVPILVALGWLSGAGAGVLRISLTKWPLVRAGFITGTFLAFYAALPFVSLSTVGAANYSAPIFVALLSAYGLQQSVGRLGWLGVLLGFVGVLVLLQPGTEAFSPWALLPLMGAMLYAGAHLVTRLKCQDVPLAALSLAQNIVMLTAGFAISAVLVVMRPDGPTATAFPYIFGTWSVLSPGDWLVLLLLAVFAVVLGILLAAAYKSAPTPIVATFEYSYLVFVASWDVVFFGVPLSAATLAGMIMIAGAGVLVIRGRAPTK